jgi:hypothetical protein
MGLRLIAALIGIVLLIVGIAFADNYRGIAGRFALWATRTNSWITRGRGPHRWLNNVAFQSIVYRVYGGIAALVGLVTLSIVVHH